METLEYRCPNCNAYLKFDAKSGNMKCDFCLGEFTVEQVRENNDTRGKIYNEGEKAAPESQTDTSAESSQGEYTAYSCPACGGEIVGDSTTVATECPFCGNPTVITQRLAGEFKPDFVIPFKLTREQAEAELAKLYKGKKLLPDAFTEDNRIKKITGMYVPYWICDCVASGEIHYKATRVHTYTDGKYLVTKTDHFSVTRGGEIAFDNIPQDGTTKLEGIHTEAIEPYDYSEMIPYSNEYLSGYFADRYDVPTDDVLSRVGERAEASVTEYFRNSVDGYATVIKTSDNLSVSHGEAHYALLPVWMLNTKWKDKIYTFAMNGQTGKMVGDLPVDTGKFWRRVAMFTGIFTAIGSLIALLV